MFFKFGDWLSALVFKFGNWLGELVFKFSTCLGCSGLVVCFEYFVRIQHPGAGFGFGVVVLGEKGLRTAEANNVELTLDKDSRGFFTKTSSPDAAGGRAFDRWWHKKGRMLLVDPQIDRSS